MTTHFMHSYSLLAIKTCHRRGAHAMGGMSAYIPVKEALEENERAMAQVRADKEREAGDGHDGTWVAHPGLVGLATEVFDRRMPAPNQVERLREDVSVGEPDLLALPDGTMTEGGLRTNISVGVQYLAAWLKGSGAVPINNLMEDAATAEICRAQLWQWIHHPRGILKDGRKVTADLFRRTLSEELDDLRTGVGDTAYETGGYDRAAGVFDKLTVNDDFIEFLTMPGYDLID
jgi:malate synthase